jgi:hypothetical protein
MTADLPPSAEWDFSVNEDDKWEACDWRCCYYYEFARHPKVVDKIVNQFRKGITATTFDGYRKATRHLPEPEGASEDYRWIRFITLFPEWPAKPFKTIGKAEWNKRIKAAGPRVEHEPFGPPIKQWNLNYIIGEYRKYAKVPKSYSDKEFERYIQDELYGPLWNGRGTIVTWPGCELVCFEVDWTYVTTKILEKFEAWLKDNHPRKVPLRFRDASGHIKNVDSPKTVLDVRPEHRPKQWPGLARDAAGHIWYLAPGQKVPGVSRQDGRKLREIKSYQDALRCLGASRVMACFKGNWAKVSITFQGNDSGIATALGKQYSSPSARSRAKKTIDRNLAEFNI